MKVCVLYESSHHSNTLKLLKAIKEKYDITLIDATSEKNPDLNEYDVIGVASGASFGKFYPHVTKAVEDCLPEGKKVFFVYTCGQNNKDYSAQVKKVAAERNCHVLGTYGCKGWDSFGPFKLIGGINKNHPDEAEISAAVDFYEKNVHEK